MKNLLAIFGLSLFIIMNGITQTQAQVTVKIKPVQPKIIVQKPAQTKTGHIWIDGHWYWDQPTHQYRWTKGDWVVARKGQKWLSGYWVDVPDRGHKWVPGHWKWVTVTKPYQQKKET